MHASDIVPHTECVAENEKQQFKVRDISELVRQGQDIVVQVVKDPLGTKGARLTTDITLPSRYLVYMPGAIHVGVSQRIESERERNRLKVSSVNIVMNMAALLFVPQPKGRMKRVSTRCCVLKRLWTKIMERRYEIQNPHHVVW